MKRLYLATRKSLAWISKARPVFLGQGRLGQRRKARSAVAARAAAPVDCLLYTSDAADDTPC
eukprot:4717913-Pyramimonas_sp.AAC.1